MKNRSINMLIAALLVVAAMAVTLIVFVQNAHDIFEEGIKVSANGVTEATVKVRNLKLSPTESTEYEVLLICDASGKYTVKLDFIETKNGGMSEFVDVRVYAGGEMIGSDKLINLFGEGKILEFEADIHSVDPCPVKIVYEMPGNVGNEAQGTYSDFKINLVIVKK